MLLKYWGAIESLPRFCNVLIAVAQCSGKCHESTVSTTQTFPKGSRNMQNAKTDKTIESYQKSLHQNKCSTVAL